MCMTSPAFRRPDQMISSLGGLLGSESRYMGTLREVERTSHSFWPASCTITTSWSSQCRGKPAASFVVRYALTCTRSWDHHCNARHATSIVGSKRSEEHTSELSHVKTSYAVFCL